VDDVKVNGELTNVSNQAVSLANDVAATRAEIDNLRKQREQYEKRMQAFKDLALKLKAMVDAGKLQVQIRKGKMLVRLPDNILFAAGSAKLKKDGEATLAEVAAALAQIPGRDFVVAGHTDSAAIKTYRFPSNWELSTARATTVLRYLLTRFRFSPERLSAVGYAEFRPIDSNDNAETRLQNRRVDFVILSSKEMESEPQRETEIPENVGSI
jgi:chemotaxis protein MotB